MNNTVLRTFFTISILLLAVVVAYPSGPGSLDLSFAGAGYKLDGFGMGWDIGQATAIQPDGKILVAGHSGIGNINVNVALARYNPDGTPDLSFNGNGKVVTSVVPGDDQGLAVALQLDGRIVVAGFAKDGTDKFLIVRFNSDGTLDLSFDGDGKVITSITGVADRARGVAIQADGKIVAAGFAANNWAVVRYNSNGSLDSTFDGDGIVTTSINSSGGLANAVAIQPDGKIITAGGCAGDFAVVRYNTDGSLDSTFDGDGTVTTPVLGGNDIAYSVALEPDGQIVAAGGAVFSNILFDFAIVRYNGDGSLDTGFSGDGKMTTAFPGGDETARSVAIQPDGKIVAAGYTQGGGNSGDFALLRCNADGSLDTTFDGDGQLTSHISDQFDGASSVAIGADGKILAVGHTQHVNDDFALIRYNSDGSSDVGFDGDGILISDIGNGGSRGRDVVVQPDGKIITAGTSVSDLALVRNDPDGSLDISFGTGGKVKTSFEFFSSNPADMVLQPDGKILIVGFTDIGPSLTRIALVRLNPDGSLDPSFDGDGKVTTSIFGGAGCAATSVAIAPDGKIVITGWGINSKITAIQYVLIRYNTNGSLDNTFDSDGIAAQTLHFFGYFRDGPG